MGKTCKFLRMLAACSEMPWKHGNKDKRENKRDLKKSPATAIFFRLTAASTRRRKSESHFRQERTNAKSYDGI